nr:MAG TPA_asm: hypothetical protein [Caudoviricetes sp.]
MCRKGDRGERPLLWVEKKLALTGRKNSSVEMRSCFFI